VTWREGTKGKMTARFATRRVLAPSDEGSRFRKDAQLTLLIEWADGEAAPSKYWLVNLAMSTGRKQLVRLAHIRWRVERDYEDLKQELGLDHYEGRGVGFGRGCGSRRYRPFSFETETSRRKPAFRPPAGGHIAACFSRRLRNNALSQWDQ